MPNMFRWAAGVLVVVCLRWLWVTEVWWEMWLAAFFTFAVGWIGFTFAAWLEDTA